MSALPKSASSARKGSRRVDIHVVSSKKLLDKPSHTSDLDTYFADPSGLQQCIDSTINNPMGFWGRIFRLTIFVHKDVDEITFRIDGRHLCAGIVRLADIHLTALTPCVLSYRSTLFSTSIWDWDEKNENSQFKCYCNKKHRVTIDGFKRPKPLFPRSRSEDRESLESLDKLGETSALPLETDASAVYTPSPKSPVPYESFTCDQPIPSVETDFWSPSPPVGSPILASPTASATDYPSDPLPSSFFIVKKAEVQDSVAGAVTIPITVDGHKVVWRIDTSKAAIKQGNDGPAQQRAVTKQLRMDGIKEMNSVAEDKKHDRDDAFAQREHEHQGRTCDASSQTLFEAVDTGTSMTSVIAPEDTSRSSSSVSKPTESLVCLMYLAGVFCTLRSFSEFLFPPQTPDPPEVNLSEYLMEIFFSALSASEPEDDVVDASHQHRPPISPVDDCNDTISSISTEYITEEDSTSEYDTADDDTAEFDIADGDWSC